jgi:hypothetical protein
MEYTIIEIAKDELIALETDQHDDPAVFGSVVGVVEIDTDNAWTVGSQQDLTTMLREKAIEKYKSQA